jgi:DNA-binding GntR family transcriptional regulator
MLRSRTLRPTVRKKTVPVRDRTYESLKAKVLSGRFKPGERLTEEHLAEGLGVSRTPVREALHKLELEGLVKPLETRGFIIPKDSRDEMEDLFDLRAVLEGFTLRLICQAVDQGNLDHLEGLVQKAEEALREGKLDDVYRWNTRFHDTLHGLVKHRHRFHHMMVNIRKYVLRYRRDTLRYPDGGKRSVEGHRKILLALRLRDPDLCERIMRAHIEEAKEDALHTSFGQM